VEWLTADEPVFARSGLSGEPETDLLPAAQDGPCCDGAGAGHFTASSSPCGVSLPARDVRITQPDQIWCADVTNIPIAHGFLYLVAIMDWYSRRVLSWQLSNSMDAKFCVVALQQAIEQYGCPSIFNTDQGSQFTSIVWTDLLKANGARISMDGKRRWMDNVLSSGCGAH